MNLVSVLQTILVDHTSSEIVDVNGIQFHSAKVNKGDIFVAIAGMEVDGHQYIEDAVNAGAVVVIGEKEQPYLPVPYFRVTNARLALALIACELYEHPSRRHIMIGITGTNGKTTTAYLIRHILESAGISCSLLGTVCHYINGEQIPSNQTTPDALQLQPWLSDSRDQVVIMEVSSHGLDQHRVGGISFDYTVFTNLSHDHLNYHKTMEEYFQTKARLFTQLKPYGEAIISSQDKWGRRLAGELRNLGEQVFTFGKTDRDELMILDIPSEYPLEIQLRIGGSPVEAGLGLPGIYNGWNAAAAWLTVHRMGIDCAVIRRALSTFAGVPGRFEVFHHPSDAEFIVDYAHTPDGLDQFLQTLHARKQTRVVHILGFRGNGDPSKRGLMLSVSAKWSDTIILTLDDLKGMEASRYLEELRHLAAQTTEKPCIVIEDRTRAIEYAWRRAEDGDLIAITGKGREVYEQNFELPSSSDVDTIQYLINNGPRTNEPKKSKANCFC